MTIDTQAQKEKLLAEKNKIESELLTIAIKDSNGVWQVKNTEPDDSKADNTELAEAAEEFIESESFVVNLKNQLGDIDEALINIENGTYGICIICQKSIEEDRLTANPPAKTCKIHM